MKIRSVSFQTKGRVQKTAKYFAIITLLISELLVGQSVVKAQPNAPFLYYYSYQRSAFIVERADGSDSRILANYKLPKGSDIGGPGWSPSGKWFVWSNYVHDGIYPNTSLFVIWVVSRDGSEVKSLLSSHGQIMSMQWSPAADILLIARVNSREDYDSEFDLLDMGTRKLTVALYQPSAGSVPNGWIGIRPDWTSDGHYASLYYSANDPTDMPQTMMRLVSSDGNLIADREVNRGSMTCPSPVFWSGNDDAIYLDPDEKTLVVENFGTSKLVRLGINGGLIEAVDWSPDSRFALIHIQLSCDADTAQLWLLSLTNQTLIQVSQNVQPRFPCCIGKDLPPSEQGNRWSPNGDKAVFVSTDGQMHLIVPSPFTVENISLPEPGTLAVNSPLIWNSTGGKLTFLWQLGTADYKTHLYSFDPVSRVATTVVPQTDVGTFSFSANDRYIALTGDCGEACIVDLITGKFSQIELKFPSEIPPTSASEFIWNSTQNWMIAMGQTNSPFYWINVVNADVSVQREIGECYIFAQSCFGWMPESETF